MPLCDVARLVGSCLAVICLVEGTVALVATATLGKNVEVAQSVGGGLALWDGQSGAWCRRVRGVHALTWNVQLSTERGLGGGCFSVSGAGNVV